MTPTRLLLVHGAFHGAWCWDRLTPELERLGVHYQTLDLPFTSPDDDVGAVRSAIDNSDENVAVLGHSFGGAVVSAAAADGGRPYGACSSLIFLTAFMIAPGQNVDFSGGSGIGKIQIGEVTASIDPDAARQVFPPVFDGGRRLGNCPTPNDADLGVGYSANPCTGLADLAEHLHRLHRRSNLECESAGPNGRKRRPIGPYR